MNGPDPHEVLIEHARIVAWAVDGMVKAAADLDGSPYRQRLSAVMRCVFACTRMNSPIWQKDRYRTAAND